MGLGADDFRVRGASAADWSDLDTSLKYVSQSPMGAAILQKAADQGTAIQITHDGRDWYDPQANTIHWDPDAAHVVLGEDGKPAGVQSSAMGLLHEGAHAVDPNIHQHLATPDRQFRNDGEAYAIKAENAVAADLGEPQRYSHEGRPHRVDDPTAHTPMKEESRSNPSADVEAIIECLLRMFLRG